MLLFNYYLSFLYTHYYKSKIIFQDSNKFKKIKNKKIGLFSYLFIIGGGVITYGR